jgi:hypothetical protein
LLIGSRSAKNSSPGDSIGAFWRLVLNHLYMKQLNMTNSNKEMPITLFVSFSFFLAAHETT